jgi:hypothetical protein
MRVFQNSGVYPAYMPRLDRLARSATTFRQRLDAFLADRYNACHILLPVLEGSPDAVYVNGDDEALQRLWAGENGLPATASLDDILLAQIEAHRTEVFYNMHPMRFGNAFLRRLPGCVRKTIAWRAAPSTGGDFGQHDLLVCNFPGILASYRAMGWRAEYFFPGHDPAMDPYADNRDRPIDVLFVGGYSRHHQQRAQVLESVARLAPKLRVQFHLDCGRLTRLAETPVVGRLLPLGQHRRPAPIQRVSAPPVFGRDLYAALSKAKIVLNGAVDMAGRDRGNMRCFEALGCGALMVSDEGTYPKGFVGGESMLTYSTPAEAVDAITRVIAEPERRAAIASQGVRTMRQDYSKAVQWSAFQQLVEAA